MSKILNIIVSIITVFTLTACSSKIPEGVALTSADLLHADGRTLKTTEDREVILRGTNAGGYLLQELWMCPTLETDSIRAESDIYRTLENRFGVVKAMELIHCYQDAFWTKEDFAKCRELGFNCIRLPFWYRNLIDKEGFYYGYNAEAEDPYAEAFERIDWFIEEAGKNGLYVILDCHGAQGSQNGSDHSGVDGREDKESATHFFFGEQAEVNQQQFIDMWEVIAKRYATNPIIAGYDILNEAFSSYRYNSKQDSNELINQLWAIYDATYDSIRLIDKNHIVIMEAIWDPTDLPNPEDMLWENVMYEYHQYCYEDYNNESGKQVRGISNKLTAIKEANYNIPSYLGEFSLQGNLSAWNEGMKLIDESGINWTTWTYKTKEENGNWGLYHYRDNIDMIDIEMDSYDIIKKNWSKTTKTVENKRLIEIIKKYL